MFRRALFSLTLAACAASNNPAPPAPVESAVPAPEPAPPEKVLEPEPEPESAIDSRVTESGLGIEDLKLGTGPEVQAGQKVTVHYVGRLESGMIFDDSHKRGEPYSFTVGDGKVIAGWDEGLVGMQVGGKRRLTVPAKLGYGERGQMPTIPPNALLEFEIELLAVE